MYVRKMPKGSNKNPMGLNEIFSNRNNKVYPIKSELQRRYCWTEKEVDNLIEQYYIEMFDRNISADEKGEDSFYGTIGDGIICNEMPNWKDTGCPYSELVDMSQRITTTYAICIVSLLLYMDKEGITDINERRKILDMYLKTKNKKSFKVETTFKDCEINKVYEAAVNGTFSFNTKEVKEANRLFKSGKNTEVVYKPFSMLVRKVYSTITDIIGTDVNFKEYLDAFLKNTYIQIEECDHKERLEKFREVNSFRVGVADADIYKSMLCYMGEKVDDKYQLFEEWVKKISSNDNSKGYKKRINILKAPYTVSEFIMKLALILLTKDEEICRFDFKLSDANKGIEWQRYNEKGILHTEEEILSFLDCCIDICEFLYNSMEMPRNFNESWYMFTEGRNTSNIWLYNILPCYVISKMNDIDTKNYAFDMLLRSYLMYSIRYLDNKSVQYIQNYLFTFAFKLIHFESKGFDTIKDQLDSHYNHTFGNFISNGMSNNLSHISFEGRTSQGAIRGILSVMEFLAQRRANVKKENIYKFLTSKNSDIDIEHIMPRNKKTDDNDVFVDGIGNLVLLESSLNSSKNDNADATSKRYTDSSFITTKLIMENSRYEGLTNIQLADLRANNIPYCCAEENLNEFDETMIKQRKNNISKMIRDFLQIE